MDHLTVVSVRRPFLPGGAVIGGGLGGFVLAFGDLLHLSELAGFGTLSIASLLAGWFIGQLKLLSRDLRGSELSGALYGTPAHLSRVRRDITQALSEQKGPSS